MGRDLSCRAFEILLKLKMKKINTHSKNMLGFAFRFSTSLVKSFRASFLRGC